MNGLSETPETEAAALLRTYNGELAQVLAVLERQLNALHMRAQVIVGFAAVAVTTTGFSGRLIAGTNVTAQVAIIVGLTAILSGCGWIFLRVLSTEWVLTRSLSVENPAASLPFIITYRDAKTRFYRRGCHVILWGLVVYAISIAIMLLNPEPLVVPVR